MSESQCALNEKLRARHISRFEWGVHIKTSTWCIDQGQTKITSHLITNTQHLCLCISVIASFVGLEGHNKQTDYFCRRHKSCFCAFFYSSVFLPNTSSSDAHGNSLKCFCDFGLCHMSHSPFLSLLALFCLWKATFPGSVCASAYFWIAVWIKASYIFTKAQRALITAINDLGKALGNNATPHSYVLSNHSSHFLRYHHRGAPVMLPCQLWVFVEWVLRERGKQCVWCLKSQQPGAARSILPALCGLNLSSSMREWYVVL